MEYSISAGRDFSVSYTVCEPSDGIRQLHLCADAVSDAAKLDMTVSWQIPDIGVHLVWTPLSYTTHTVVPNWGGYSDSCAMYGAPVYTDLDFADRNRQTIACSDAKNQLRIHTGVIEETGELDCVVKIHVASPIRHYEADIRIDTRDIPFWQALDDVRAWWENYDGCKPMRVPDAAKQPLYSAWYSYHQNIDVEKIAGECAYFSRLGTKVLIVDDGWQTDNTARGFDFCGDWQPTPTKVPSMKAFVDAVHKTGMKFMIWFSVPYIGETCEAFRIFGEKTLYRSASRTHVLDPRYPDVREHLIGLYKKAVAEWGLDGLKLDFIDSFRQTDHYDAEMDYVSVYDAVDRLMKDVSAALTAIKPDILLEFRQNYIGPLMRTFGNMFRSSDCPADSFTNRQHILALRMLSGNTAVHSDMVMWHPGESAEQAAFQLTSVLFSVPQISVGKDSLTEEQAEMVRDYLAFWTKYRHVLLDGQMFYHGCGANYPYVSSRLGDTEVGAVYSGMTAYLETPADEIVIVNGSMDRRILLDAAWTGNFEYAVYRCTGKKTAEGTLSLTEPHIPAVIGNVPVNGRIVLNRCQ